MGHITEGILTDLKVSLNSAISPKWFVYILKIQTKKSSGWHYKGFVAIQRFGWATEDFPILNCAMALLRLGMSVLSHIFGTTYPSTVAPLSTVG